MAARASVRGQDRHGLASVLASAALEWLLIFLLFLDALFAYLVRRFASFFELQTPCLFCSRLDHILGGEKAGFYTELICRSHKLEISSLVYCHAHEKLTNVNGVCEGCLFSFTTEKKSNCETFKSLVGKLGPGLTCYAGEDDGIHLKVPEIAAGDEECLLKDHFLEDLVLDSAGTNLCLCCNLPLRKMIHSNPLTWIKSMDVEVSKLHQMSAATENNHLIHQDGFVKGRGRQSVPESYIRNHYFDPLSHVGYMEVNITSDSESEVPLSENDDDKRRVHETDGCEFLARCLKPESISIDTDIPLVTESTNLIREKLIHQSSLPEPSFPVPDEPHHVGEGNEVFPQMLHVDDSEHPDALIESPSTDFAQEKHVDKATEPVPLLPIPYEQLHVDEPPVVSSIASTAALENGLEELPWDAVGDRINPPLTSEPMFHELSSLPTSEEVGVSSDHCAAEVNNLANATTESVKSIKPENEFSSIEAQSKTDQTIDESTVLTPNCMDLNDAYKLVIGNRKSLPSDATTEVTTGKDSTHDQKDLRLLLSQISATQGFDLLWNGMSPRIHTYGDDSKASETSSSVTLQILQKRPSRNESGFESWDGILQKRLSRNESGFESWDGSIVSEIDGESAIDRLKRQLEKDRKCMSTLYKELEEERNASSIAANQAMAMINKLQEEKATLQMEAFQYQRMMEEQAEYDQEAIQRLNELLIQKEKKIQELDAEVESYRSTSGSEPTVEKLSGSEIDLNGEDMRIDSSLSNSTIQDSSQGFEGEKAYISKCLDMLEKKLHLFSNNSININDYKLDADGDGLAGGKSKVFEEEQDLHEDASKIGGIIQEDQPGGNDVMQVQFNEKVENLLAENDSSIGNRKEGVSKGSCLMAKENHSDIYPIAGSDFNPAASGGKDLVAIGDEVSGLRKRLATLEADHNFLEHTVNSLRSGNQGFQFVQEIAEHLRELRRIGVGRRATHCLIPRNIVKGESETEHTKLNVEPSSVT